MEDKKRNTTKSIGKILFLGGVIATFFGFLDATPLALMQGELVYFQLVGPAILVFGFALIKRAENIEKNKDNNF